MPVTEFQRNGTPAVAGALRRTLAWLLGLGGPLLLLLQFAGVGSGSALSAAQRLQPDPARWDSASSGLGIEQAGVRLFGRASDGSILLLQTVEPFEATSFRFFRLHIDELVSPHRGFLYLRVDGRDRFLAIPSGLRGATTVDLAADPGWSGRIDAVGLLISTTDFLAPQHAPEREPLLREFAFESDNLPAALAALSTHWFAYRPWNGRSNHTGGYEYGPLAGPSLQAWLAGALGCIGIALFLFPGGELGRRRFLQAVLGALLLVALAQAGQLFMRAGVAVEARLAVADDPAWPLAAMPLMANDAKRLLEAWKTTPPSRVLVWGNSNFTREYPSSLLRSLNVASLYVPQQAALVAGEPGVVLVLGGPGGWTYDAASQQLDFGGFRLPARRRESGALLHSFDLIGDTAP